MDKEEWKSFLRWLDQASTEELHERKARLAVVLRAIGDPDVRADVRRLNRLIDQDLLTRAGLQQRATARRSRPA